MNRFSSILGQILHLFSRREFFEMVYTTQAERGAKGFGCWDQFMAMSFCQLGQAHSLREICGGLASCFGKAKHLELHTAPKRSTLALTFPPGSIVANDNGYLDYDLFWRWNLGGVFFVTRQKDNADCRVSLTS